MGRPSFCNLNCKVLKKYSVKVLYRSMKITFKRIIDKYKKKEQRGTGKKLIGVK